MNNTSYFTAQLLHEAGLLVGDLGLHAEVVLQEGAQRPVGAPNHLGIGLALLGEDHPAVAALNDHSHLLELGEGFVHAGL